MIKLAKLHIRICELEIRIYIIYEYYSVITTPNKRIVLLKSDLQMSFSVICVLAKGVVHAFINAKILLIRSLMQSKKFKFTKKIALTHSTLN
jgi:hypothetical protein